MPAVRSSEHFARRISYSLRPLGTSYLARVTAAKGGIPQRNLRREITSFPERSARNFDTAAVLRTGLGLRNTVSNPVAVPRSRPVVRPRTGRSRTSPTSQKRTMFRPTSRYARPMPITQFVSLPPTIWILDPSIADFGRRQALLSPPSFEQILAELSGAVTVRAVKSERMESWIGPSPSPQRVTVILDVPDHSNLVDVFHNSCAGVRAQCLHSVEVGAAALDYARDKLREKALWLTQARPRCAISRDVVEQSLALSSTKVWIHQGHWVRHARMADRHLRIAQWEAHEATATGRERRLIRYGSKAPYAPSAVDVIGGWVHPAGLTIGKPPADRPRQVHKYGFT